MSDRTALDTGATCPFGHCGEHVVLAEFEAGELAAAWKRHFGVDCRDAFAEVGTMRLNRCQTCGIGFFEPMIAGDERFYLALSKWWKGYRSVPTTLENKQDYAAAIAYMTDGDRVLEVGCGRVMFQKHIPKTVTYIGLELNTDWVELSRAAGIDARHEMIEEHAKHNVGAYDVVCTFQVVEHIPNLRSFVDGCCASIRPGGYFIVACPNAEGFIGYQHDNVLNMPPYHVTWWSPVVARFLAETWNLEIVELSEMPLERQHYREFMRLLWFDCFNEMLGLRNRFIFSGARYKVLRLVAGMLARLTTHSLGTIAGSVKGHSIVAVYRKPINPR